MSSQLPDNKWLWLSNNGLGYATEYFHISKAEELRQRRLQLLDKMPDAFTAGDVSRMLDMNVNRTGAIIRSWRKYNAIVSERRYHAATYRKVKPTYV